MQITIQNLTDGKFGKYLALNPIIPIKVGTKDTGAGKFIYDNLANGQTISVNEWTNPTTGKITYYIDTNDIPVSTQQAPPNAQQHHTPITTANPQLTEIINLLKEAIELLKPKQSAEKTAFDNIGNAPPPITDEDAPNGVPF